MNTDNKRKSAAPAFLVQADSFEKGCEKVTHFLDKTALVKYDNIEFNASLSFPASHQKFWELAERGLKKNRQSITHLIAELQESGYNQLSELAEMKQGYESKTLHILVHLLDGFIGIDTSFYNLIEDSHQISEPLCLEIKQTPDQYLLLQVNAEKLWTFL